MRKKAGSDVYWKLKALGFSVLLESHRSVELATSFQRQLSYGLLYFIASTSAVSQAALAFQVFKFTVKFALKRLLKSSKRLESESFFVKKNV